MPRSLDRVVTAADAGAREAVAALQALSSSRWMPMPFLADREALPVFAI
ncbi:hypothetical protein [Mycobacterium sp. Lab-001]